MVFEFNQEKSRINLSKHGIDFNEAQLLWNDPNAIVIPARTVDEPRYLLIAELDGRHWTSIFTIRNKKIRIISVRRSRKNEEKIYQS